MKISEIIFENCVPGWQPTEFISLKDNQGFFNLSHRLNQNCDVDEILFVFENKNIVGYDPDNEYGWVISVKVKDGDVLYYDYFKRPKGIKIGSYTTIEDVKDLFDRMTLPYLIKRQT